MAPAGGNDDGSARGRRLFEAGIGRDGRPVEAMFAESATPIPGALLSCAGCHGRDGKGRTVAGVDPPDITWQTLAKPYALRVGTGRIRPPYDEALVVRAVTTGRDSGGSLLGSAMPRFRLTPGDAADLVAYLRELGSKPDPGVSTDALSIGVILPPRAQGSAVRDSVHVVLDDYREKLNREGGIFGRRVEFSFMESATDLDERQSAARALTIQETVLALLVGDDAGVDPDVAAVANQKGVPLVAIRADKDPSPARHVFYLSAGVVGELGALVVQAARQLDAGRARLVVVYRNDDGRDLMAALRLRIERTGWQTVDEVRLPVTGEPDDLPDETLRRIASGDAVLIMTPELRSGKIFRRLAAAGRNPLLLLPGSMAAPGWLPQDAAPQMRIFLGFGPTALTAVDIRSDPTSVRDGGIRVPVLAAQRTALAAAKLLVEGLRRAGRDVTRARLIDAIETIQRFETGYLPPLSYGPRQHIGFTGAQIVPFDPRRRQLMEPVGRIELD